ncbi:TrbG/VirB9 family P-type conjugative transfer protein [Sphingomonas sp. CGMCC 1.13654]|uniref:TrbG/VirB9 family P-type conjugative transfer protein n=1 Tax=Sphingomonas chungangi TaxID=2683589 RepID=A0A838L1S1_9SPHN|nr:TrbG/VirB9 family P-type conjugative transfer protein [Sphingomonas chungangi]MBA2932605.1 TrbG/VirB9 family P-type conjugative transfer protein [Sphingomonas chungangi]MVW56228.1 hypothetical protein [Sphingomonas chungangi]
MDYAPNRSWSINTAPGGTSFIMLTPGERIDTVVMSDPGAYQVAVTAARDGLYLRQKRPDARGTMTVSAGSRIYAIDVTSDPNQPAPYVVAFKNVAAAAVPAAEGQSATPVAASGSYKLTGDKDVRPLSVSDDGSKTYIRWAPDQSIPAVFALEGASGEETINGYMRDGVFTIDRVYERLIFRIDKAVATAARVSGKRKP